MKYYTMTNSSSDSIAKKDSKINTPLLLSIFLIISGVIAILMPNISTIVAETWISVILTVSGVTKLIYAFQSREEGGFIWKLLLSILYIATGIYLFVFPLSGILTLTLLFGSFLLTEGVFELILAYQLRSQKNWGWILTNAIITLVLGGIVWAQWPSDAPWLIGTLLGVSILSTGISRLVMSLNPPSDSSVGNVSSSIPTS
jgi:uncharacterized membrane protein HdeD (DUF308 family)